jgi:uncharacterized protein (DUF2249 family)
MVAETEAIMSLTITEAPTHAAEPVAHPFDARGIAKRFRHAAIFGALDALGPGEAMRFMNDHDPLPLLAQLEARFGETLQVEYRHRSATGVIIDFIRTA